MLVDRLEFLTQRGRHRFPSLRLKCELVNNVVSPHSTDD
jgi:hypothetical protein